MRSGSFHGKSSVDAPVVVADDPRWPLLNRWSQSSPLMKPSAQATVGPMTDGPSAAKSSTSSPPPSLARSSPQKTTDLISSSISKFPQAAATPTSLPVPTCSDSAPVTAVVPDSRSGPVHDSRPGHEVDSECPCL